MMAALGYTPSSLINTLWMSADEVRELVRLDTRWFTLTHTQQKHGYSLD